MTQTGRSFSLWGSRGESLPTRRPVSLVSSVGRASRCTGIPAFFSPAAGASSPSASLAVAIPQFPALSKMRLCHTLTRPFPLLVLSSLLLSLSFLSGMQYAAASSPTKIKRPVTYGSSIVLVHAATGYKIFSGKISWGSGSGQQAVTAMPPDERASVASVFWNVEPPQNNNRPRALLSPVLQEQSVVGGSGRQSKPAAGEPVPALATEGAAGEPVPCGATVVFEHALSSVSMQALGISSPISNNREVSAASGSQASLAGFKVLCSDRSAKRWMTGDQVTLQHFALGANLQAEKQHKFTPYNCGRGCPIEGHIEVSINNNPRSSSSWGWATPNDVWIAEPGILVGRDRFAFVGADGDEEETDRRDEL